MRTDGRTPDHRYTISSGMSLRLRCAKNPVLKCLCVKGGFVPNVLSSRDLVFRPNIMNETVVDCCKKI